MEKIKCDIERLLCVCASVWVLCVHFSEHNEQSLGEFGKLNFESWNVGHFKGEKC